MAVSTVENLPLQKLLFWNRAGVILYRILNDKIELVLGVDKTTSEISNFAGKVKLNENPIQAAQREFLEESLGVFGKLDNRKIENSMAVYNDMEIIIFVKLDYNKEQAIKKFDQRLTSYSEMKSLFFCSLDEFIDLLTNETENLIYFRVRKLIIEAFSKYGNFLLEPPK